MKKKILSIKLKAFTLAELLVVLCIIGILVLLALPNLMPLISKAKGTEAKLQLEHLRTLEKTYFYIHSKYTNDLKELGFEQSKLIPEGGDANYKIDVKEVGPNSFRATATSVADFDGDGTYNVWEINQENNLTELTPD